MACLHPLIIPHPSLRRYILSGFTLLSSPHCPSVDLTTMDFSYRGKASISRRIAGVVPTLDNYDSFVVTDVSSGECRPVFMLVPCGKCINCCNSRTNEWAFRAQCEASMSSTPPLFVTLTYNDRHVPADGVNKREIQLFLKRLRVHLIRAGYTTPIRYIACGEYGSKTHRPHYHLILFDFPLMDTVSERLRFIEDSYKSDGNIGYCYVKTCDFGAISYVLKYMRKPVSDRPTNRNPEFFLASRRRGIGYSYLKENLSYISQPEVVQLSVVDAISGRTFTSPVPKYFTRIIRPCNSALVSNPISQLYLLLISLLTEKKYFHYSNDLDPFILNPIQRNICEAFSFIMPFSSVVTPSIALSYREHFHYSTRTDYYSYLNFHINSICDFLMDYLVIDKKVVSLIEQDRETHRLSCYRYYSSMSTIPPDEQAYLLLKKLNISLNRELI